MDIVQRHFSLVIIIGIMPYLPVASIPHSALEARTTDISPLLFVQNAGQWPAATRFQAQTSAGTLWLANDALWLTVHAPAPPPPSGASGILRIVFPLIPAPAHISV